MKYPDFIPNSKSSLWGGIALVIVITYGTISFYGMNSLQNTAEWVNHTHEVIAMAADIEKNIIDLETGQRGFLITGEDSFLEPYNDSRAKLFDLLEATRNIVSDNPKQVDRLTAVEELLKEWFKQAGSKEINERRKVRTGVKDADYLQELLSQGTGKDIFDNIRVVLAEMNAAFQASNNLDSLNLTLAIAKDLVEMETGERGFLITGKKNFLAPFELGKQQLGEHIDQLHMLINRAYDRQAMHKDIATVQDLAQQWRSQAGEPEIKLRRDVNKGRKQYQDMERVLSKKQGKNILDKLRGQLTEMSARFERGNNQHGQNLILSIAKAMVDQETGQRGFMLTGKEAFLAPYLSGQQALEQHLNALKILVNKAYDINSSRRSLNKVEQLAKEWLEQAGVPEIEARQEINKYPVTLKSVIALIKAETGKNIMDEMRTLLLTFIQIERVLMEKRQAEATATSRYTLWIMLFGTLAIVIFAITIVRTSNTLQTQTKELESERNKLEQQDWVKSNFTEITSKIQGLRDLQVFAEIILKELVPRLDAHLGLFYITDTNTDNEKVLSLLGSYAYQKRKEVSNSFKFGESLIGQSALEKKSILLTNAPSDYIQISSGSGSAAPNNIIVFPLLFEDMVLAVIEVASLTAFTDLQQELIDQIAHNCGVIFNNIDAQIRTEELLQQSQTQSEELQTQQEELQVSNENLEEQTQRLQASEEELKQQSEELRVANEEMEEKQQTLQRQTNELKLAKNDLEIKAQDLTQASKYKTEFLANMSHELRTPLNSLLILSKELTKNKEGNLNEHQVEDATIIYEGGQSLLNLINDIMDLSKVEAGMLTVHNEEVVLEDLGKNLERLFNGVAIEKGLTFTIEQDDRMLNTIVSDELRLEQILKNFLSNAFKFTEKGSIALSIFQPDDSVRFKQAHLSAQKAIAFAVTDTGIGIPEQKQQAIFEAFQQEDGSTSRKYGGTGLGLTISRELAHLLGGEITLQSKKGEGCTFTLYLPLHAEQPAEMPQQHFVADSAGQILTSHLVSTPSTGHEAIPIKSKDKQPLPAAIEAFMPDDRRAIHEGDNTLLIIEDDRHFAKILMDIAHESAFKCIAADKGRDGVFLAIEYTPDGILLDIGLPDIDGINVLEQLKYNLITRHIPVHIISGLDKKQASLHQGAISFIEKPADAEEIKSVLSRIVSHSDETTKNILVVEDDTCSQKAIQRLIKTKGVDLTFASTGKEAGEKLDAKNYDCIILDLGLPDVSGISVLNKINAMPSAKPPVIVYTGQEISDQDQLTLSKFAADIIIKGAESPERLLDDVSLFLHSVATNLSDEQKKTISMLHDEDSMLRGRKIMLVDDDMRNVFAMSRQLGEAGLNVTMADNGQSALDLLETQSDTEQRFELILMDIMMPVMDGYEAMQHIRKMPEYKQIPIIALTAKAMPEDRAKCLEAGASEYIMKPVDMEKLLSMLRVWLYKHH